MAEECEGQAEGRCEAEESFGGPVFEPRLYVQRYYYVQQQLRNHNVTSVSPLCIHHYSVRCFWLITFLFLVILNWNLCDIICHFCVTCLKQRWHLGIPSPSFVRPSVRPSVCLSVCPYVTLFLSHFLFCYNSSSTDAIEMKLHMWIELKQVKIHNSGMNISGAPKSSLCTQRQNFHWIL